MITPFLGTCDTLLDLGCGGGRFTPVLLPKCSNLIAADTSANMLKLMQEAYPQEDRIYYKLLDGFGLNGIDFESVDRIFCFGVFVHLQQWDIFHYIMDISRVLKPGGKALVHHMPIHFRI